MNGTPLVEGLDRLVLVWLAVPRKKPAIKTLASMLAAFVGGTGMEREAAARGALARLKARGAIAADSVWILSPAGLEEALSALALPALPKRVSWRWVHTLLVARGNGTDVKPAALRRVATSDGLTVAILGERHQLGALTRTELSASQVACALAWRELGVRSTAPFTVKAVLAHLVNRAGAAPVSPGSTREALAILAAQALGVTGGDAARRAVLVQRWMAASAGEPAGTEAEPVVPATQTPIELFAQKALAAARAAKTGRWGEHKVFVSHVLAELKRREPEGIADLGDFKQRLLRANQAGLLSLSRADLVEAMDPADVRASEISSLGATFHFVRLD